MTRTEFIEKLRLMADELEIGSWKIIDLESGYIFGNKNYGEVHCDIANGVSVIISLYSATEEEKNTFKHIGRKERIERSKR